MTVQRLVRIPSQRVIHPAALQRFVRGRSARTLRDRALRSSIHSPLTRIALSKRRGKPFVIHTNASVRVTCYIVDDAGEPVTIAAGDYLCSVRDRYDSTVVLTFVTGGDEVTEGKIKRETATVNGAEVDVLTFTAANRLVAGLEAGAYYADLIRTDSPGGWKAELHVVVRKGITPFVAPVLWSTLGIIDDATTDNTDALNALPVGVPIICDSPNNNKVKFDGRWYLRSHLQLWTPREWDDVHPTEAVGDVPGPQGGPEIKPTLDTPNDGVITQADINTPIENVVMDGLKFFREATGRIFQLHVQRLHMCNLTAHHKFGFAFIGGSDHEIAFNTVTTGPNEFDGPGLRHVGNVPLVETTPSLLTGIMKPANVWIHDNDIISHDATYQIDQAAGWMDKEADDYLIEDNVGGSEGHGRALLLGSAPSHITKNVIIRRMDLFAPGIQARIRNGGVGGGGFSNILLEDIEFDASAQTSDYGVQLLPDLGPIDGVTMRRVNVRSPFRAAFKIDEGFGHTRIAIIDCIGEASRHASQDTALEVSGAADLTVAESDLDGRVLIAASSDVEIADSDIGPIEADGVDVLKIRRNDIAAGDFGGMKLGNTAEVTGLEVDENNISGVDAGDFGVHMVHVTGGTVSGNVVAGDVGAKALKFTADPNGTHNVDAQNNDFTALNDLSCINYAAGQGNNATNNAGATDHTG